MDTSMYIVLALITAFASGIPAWVVTQGATFWKRSLIWLYTTICVGLIFAYVRPHNSTVHTSSDSSLNANGHQRRCVSSFCVTPGERVLLDTTNCKVHADNLNESLHKISAGTDDAFDRICAKFSNLQCVTCNGACVETSTSTCSSKAQHPHQPARLTNHQRQDIVEKDQSWQLTDEELIRSWKF